MLGLMIVIMLITNTFALCAVLLLSKRYRKLHKQYECTHYKLINIHQQLDIVRFAIRKLVERENDNLEILSNVRRQPTDYGKEAI
ncbi:hypothetical protein [Photobacterium satsumensis]|uniref:hypothetical protein n=1 Tax=Photobacterium satsumensis TaxID=2910239 RepID=UPI003D0A8623